MEEIEIEYSQRNSACASLEDFCIFSDGRPQDYLELTDLGINRGIDIYISDRNGIRQFQLTYGQIDALKECMKLV